MIVCLKSYVHKEDWISAMSIETDVPLHPSIRILEQKIKHPLKYIPSIRRPTIF